MNVVGLGSGRFQLGHGEPDPPAVAVTGVPAERYQFRVPHGGRIDVASSARDGTAFKVVLPRIAPTSDLETDERL